MTLIAKKLVVVGSAQNRKAFKFLSSVEKDDRTFQLSELLSATGWRKGTAKQYLSTRLKQFVYSSGNGYRVKGCISISQDDFCNLVSQSVPISRDPLKPQLSDSCEERLAKAREAALAAVQHYNNPTATFKTGTYLILMVVAFTALFHAVFEREGVSYISMNASGGRRKVAGRDALWDALESANYYVKTYKSLYLADENKLFLSCMLENLKLLLPIRHIFEHRDMPPVDPALAAHCQSMLFNFETILTQEFTHYYTLNASLTMALQFSTVRNEKSLVSAHRFQTQEYEELKKYINDFQIGLSNEVMENPAFAFRVWLVAKPAKEGRKSDISIEYVRLDSSDPNQMAALQQSIVAIKQSIRPVSNTGLLKPKQVAEQVASALGCKFLSSTHHVRAWKHFKIRPEAGHEEPNKTNSDFCIYDEAHKDYLYTDAWVKYLIKQLANKEVYAVICDGPKKYTQV